MLKLKREQHLDESKATRSLWHMHFQGDYGQTEHLFPPKNGKEGFWLKSACQQSFERADKLQQLHQRQQTRNYLWSREKQID